MDRDRRLEDASPPAESAERLLRVSYFDALTGAYNRTLFTSILEETVNRSRQRDENFVLLDVDIDRFRMMNEAFGQHFGDTVLREVVARIARWLAPQEVQARIGSDEFAILLPRVTPDPALEWRLSCLLRELALPLPGDDAGIALSVSIGIATFPNDGATASELLHHAGAALGRAKQQAQQRFVHYTPMEAERSRNRLLLESRLRRAIENNVLQVRLQPQVLLTSNHLHGAEALARWTDADLGAVSPDVFIRLAEETGLARDIDEQVLTTVISHAARWQAMGIPPFPIGVNLSALHFTDNRLKDLVAGLLDRHGLDPAWLMLELTETALLADADRTRMVMESLGALGVRFSLDDFGTGYSSLSHLHQFPISEIKIDRSFVCRIPGSEPHLRIIRAVINLAHDLGKTVVAEGVESAEQIAVLNAMNCGTGQGYAFDRGIVVDSFEKRWLPRLPPQTVKGQHHAPSVVVV